MSLILPWGLADKSMILEKLILTGSFEEVSIAKKGIVVGKLNGEIINQISPGKFIWDLNIPMKNLELKTDKYKDSVVYAVLSEGTGTMRSYFDVKIEIMKLGLKRIPLEAVGNVETIYIIIKTGKLLYTKLSFKKKEVFILEEKYLDTFDKIYKIDIQIDDVKDDIVLDVKTSKKTEISIMVVTRQKVSD